MAEQLKCQAVFTSRDAEQRECGKPATYAAYLPPIFFCYDCLHDCMEDASLEEQSSVLYLKDARR